MSWFAAKELDNRGELVWERDIWNDSIDMVLWMELSWYQKHGKMFDEELPL